MKTHLFLTLCLLLHTSYSILLFMSLFSDCFHALCYFVTIEEAIFSAIMVVALRINATLSFHFLNQILCLSLRFPVP